MRSLCPAAGRSLEPRGLVGVGANNWSMSGALGAAPGDNEETKSSSGPYMGVPRGTSRQVPVLMSRREGTGLGYLCSSCSPEGCVRLCFLCVCACVAGWVGSVTRVQLSAVDAQPLLHSGRGNCSSPTPMGLRQEDSPWLPLPIRFSYL